MQKVSIIIPTKDSDKTLSRCLKSIHSQSYPHIEVIVVDNFSHDNTQKIAHKYAQFVFSSGPERSAQRNFGVKRSSGTFVMIVDSDMYLSKNVVKECVEAMKTEIIGIFIPERVLGDTFWTQVRNFERGFYNSTCVDAVRFIRRKDYDRMGGFDEDLNVAEDWDFNRRILKRGKACEIKAHILHDESNFAISTYIGKKKSYFTDLQLYIDKWGNDSIVKKQTGFWYRMIWVFLEKDKWKRVARHPILTIAMLILRCLIGFEYIISIKHYKMNK